MALTAHNSVLASQTGVDVESRWAVMRGNTVGYWDPMPSIAGSGGAPFGDSPLGTLVVLPEPDEYLRGRWEMRNWRNVPGPFYGADTDTCWTGRAVAARHVLYDDEYGQEFVYRQPVTSAEVHDVLVAACSDPFGGYAADGDEHWTLATVRDWWRDRQRLIEWIYRARDRWHGSTNEEEYELINGLVEYARYIDDGLEAYLRCYAFWLDHHRAPHSGDPLPDL